ncbi:hypothetical protein [Glaesserella parasuis]|uniref:hypothetical protein n=2 Tax=Glaesserella parasuis TaxID=738 RepID=UPI0005C6F7E5|nr:hypothetical protein [Glaesserella parasuis]MCT8561385.1 hypothetical protein [Glaesserella parasuis]MDG6231465.1 hypothetical protein [Glaesserella parasuis]MDG6856986.1 hypothetical protein [Glaesserella parasuis]MDP0192754.1 hypothetical protein [Glaesserella parasuis]MDP0381490.1 hypothetical protein [Glaesserella parasuis]
MDFKENCSSAFGQGLKEEVLDISDELVLNLVNQVSSLLGGKNNRVYHGSFIEKSNMIKNFPFEFDKTYSLDKSSTGPTPISNEAFIIFTKSIMRRLKASVKID